MAMVYKHPALPRYTTQWQDAWSDPHELERQLELIVHDVRIDDMDDAVIWWTPAEPRAFLDRVVGAIGDFLGGVANAVGDVVQWASDFLQSGLGKAAVTGLCSIFTGGNVPACSAGTAALARALATVGASPVRAEQAHERYQGPGYELARYDRAWIVYPPGQEPSAALQQGKLGLWAPGMRSWQPAAAIPDLIHRLTADG